MAQIRLQLVEAGGLFSRAIGRFGGGGWAPEYSHVDCVTSSGALVGARDDVLNGVPAGVQIRHQNYELWVRRDVYTLSVTDEQEKAWDLAVYSGIGAKYDEDAILSYVFRRRWHRNGDFICSAYATTRLQIVGLVPKELDFEPQGWSPNGVAYGLAYLGATVQRNPNASPQAPNASPQA